ncbi:protoheme IX farnesyltransferase [Cryobacterium breve]|uniref:Protoheme IX farnesyltransferase n=2 Tax=Microbacteriaceae TaxID=85023 RepID=A0ABY2J0G3_9MICO|nr:protoheme IX farnesyltransferase [Cryobacterium sp. TmT3-12]TFC97198.1 protoheme IX farnesyltransferase [Cryobacterium breve]
MIGYVRQPDGNPFRMTVRAPFFVRNRVDGTDGALAGRANGTSVRDTVTRYYSLTKPGVLYGNALTAAAGFLLAARGQVDLFLFAALCVGTTLVIASATVLNNVLDRDIDTVMERTKKRATVTGRIGVRNAVIFSTVLFVLGMAMLVAWTNWLVVVVGLGGFLVYVVLYGMLSKRLSIHGTLVGSVSGAAPILAGYVAVTGDIDVGAVLAFLAVFLWQMPEFYSIAIYRHDEYARAGVPVISVVRGIPNTTVQILVYTIGFVVSTLLLPVFGYVGYVYTAMMGVLGAYWIWLGIVGLRAADPAAWARRMFRYSLVMILVYCLMISVGPVLP